MKPVIIWAKANAPLKNILGERRWWSGIDSTSDYAGAVSDYATAFGFAASCPQEFFAEIYAYIIEDPVKAKKVLPKEVIAFYKRVFPNATVW